MKVEKEHFELVKACLLAILSGGGDNGRTVSHNLSRAIAYADALRQIGGDDEED